MLGPQAFRNTGNFRVITEFTMQVNHIEVFKYLRPRVQEFLPLCCDSKGNKVAVHFCQKKKQTAIYYN